MLYGGARPFAVSTPHNNDNYSGGEMHTAQRKSQTHGILIVEDDFRIAEIHRAFIEQSEGFAVVAMARNGAEARELMIRHGHAVHLVLLDAYLPDVNGLELLWSLRHEHQLVGIVIVTAAREVAAISDDMRFGHIAYLLRTV